MSLYPNDKGILEDEALRRISVIEEALRQDEFCIGPEPAVSAKGRGGPQSEVSDDAKRRKTKQLRSLPVSRRGSLGEQNTTTNLAVQPSLRALGITQASSRPISTSSPADGARDLSRGLDLPKVQRRPSAADTTSGVSRRSSLGSTFNLNIPGRRGSSVSLQGQRPGSQFG